MSTPSVDATHSRPDGVSDELIAATGKLAEALTAVERARGALYDLHRLVGDADEMLDDVVAGLRESGRDDLADRVRDELIGRNVLDGRWTFQIVEEFDDGYYTAFRELEKDVRSEIVGGRRHVFEAELKERRRTAGKRGHEPTPS
ncbi:hypothetical protein [Pseudonocardia sp. TRM90224]|uniref:hypothetical protein n=1 Tax=Pseudonocardia sp. TRM90224 TaxID=2812678 RepID=UPI001E550D87|nr:hypothetical protein [Pseudonocardia sp. TRM90224]